MSRPVRSTRRLLTATPLALAALALAAGCGGRGDGGSDVLAEGSVSSGVTTLDPTEPAATSGAAVPGAVAVAQRAARPVQPVRIQVPAIGVDATVTELGIGSGGAIEVPGDPARAGWLDTTPAPGQQGPAVIAGHVDSTSGPAVFYRLGELEVGDPVVVTRRDGRSVTFTVDGVRTYAKRAFPTREVYGPVPGPVLRLVTCGGAYDAGRGGYQDNVVVYAS